MKITTEQHAHFLDLEIRAQIESFKQTAETKAIQLLVDDKLFIGQFLKYEDGQLIIKFSIKRSIPRKNHYLMCLLPPSNLVNYQNWGKISYREMIREKLIHSEIVCIWQKITADKKYFLVGFRGVTIEFTERLVKNCILIFGPIVPPLEYLTNLKKLVESPYLSKESKSILDIEDSKQSIVPTLVPDNKNLVLYFLNQLLLEDVLIVQGPPGTGKTYLMSQICEAMMQQGKSILVTALTNKALMELAQKPALAAMCEAGRVEKFGLTIDELEKIKGIKNCKGIVSKAGHLVLSTFYKSSALAIENYGKPIFDVVIIDEASQALLSTFAAMRMLGEKNIWIGDTAQLPPIVVLNQDTIQRLNGNMLVEGMKTLVNAYAIPYFQLTKSFRLPPRAATFTGIFYNNSLVSASHAAYNFNQLSFGYAQGGPVLHKLPLSVGEKCPTLGIDYIVKMVTEMIETDKPLRIAVLSFFIKTVNELQKNIYSRVAKSDKIIIETVSSIQGLTCDICIYFVPNTGYIYSLNRALFNVATSRATQDTIIVTDNEICETKSIDEQVMFFLNKLEHLDLV